MELTVNGKPYRTQEAGTLRELIEELEGTEGAEGVAVAVNETVVPKARWQEHTLQNGAVIEVIRAVQGG